MTFSVLISIHKGESPVYFDQALCSVWDMQSLKPGQIVVVIDGALSEALEAVLLNWQSRLGDKITLVRLRENVGLGVALNEGLKYCRFDLVARMDTDDVALADRFLHQVSFMEENPSIAVSSAWVQEFDQDMNHSEGVRKVPVTHEEIVDFGKRRNPLSHPVVIFHKSAVAEVGGYPPFRKSQDYALWSLLLTRGFKMANIPRVLLQMRTGKGLMVRRGRSYLMHEYRILHYQKQIGFIGWKDFLINLAIRSAVRLPPSAIRRIIYKLVR